MDFIKKTLIEKGWSDDKKYCVVDKNGNKYLYRVSNVEQIDKKKEEFDMMKKVFDLGVPICEPLKFGVNEEGVFSIQEWIEGTMAIDTIPYLSDTEQYVYGLNAGQYLKKIHSIPAPKQIEDWESRFNRKIDSKIEKYLNCPFKYDEGEIFIEYITSHQQLLKNRPQCFQHGDYHLGNMIIDADKKLRIIDFNRFDYGDPIDEFNRFFWCVERSSIFSSGLINGYFDHQVPESFWKLFALYVLVNTISSLEWSIKFGQKEVDTMIHQAKEVNKWYDSMKNIIPNWYFKGYFLQKIDNLYFKMKNFYDFSFLKKFGSVFKVFDDQDSGNICFGIKQGEKRLFVKFAGSQTDQYDGNPKDAIKRLKSCLPIYQDLKHPNLIKFIKAENVGNGFAMIFDWADGECMGRMYPASRKKFLEMKTEIKLKVFNDVLSFFQYIVSQNYVAIDFYDGSIMYDFDKNRTTICDIDFFRKMPFKNEMGRLYGSSLFQSPEEYQLGAIIDEITNVYTIGATAFAFFSNFDRTGQDWILSKKLYDIALKAVSDERDKRQQSIQDFINEWNNALRGGGY